MLKMRLVGEGFCFELKGKRVYGTILFCFILQDMKSLAPQLANQGTHPLMQVLFLHPERHNLTTPPLHFFLH